MGFEELAGRRVRRQHFLDPLAQVRVLATLLGEARGPLVGCEFAGGIEDFFFPISVKAHDTKGACTRDYAFSHSKRSIESRRQVLPIGSKRGIDLSIVVQTGLAGAPESLRNNLHGNNHEGSIPFTRSIGSKGFWTLCSKKCKFPADKVVRM
jgi:hypothetical protein